MHIELKTNDRLTDSERLGLETLSAEAFPPDGTNIQWSAESDWHVLVWEDAEIVSHVEIIERTTLVGGKPIHLGGIGGVATLKAWRKRGLAEAALKVAQAYIKDPMAVDFGLLVCGETMVPYYSKFGWKLVARQMWIDQPQGRIIMHDVPIMVLPVCQSNWPSGEIDLCGRPW